MDVFLYQGTIYLCAAVIAVPLAARLGLGSVLGYLAAGIVIGPILHLVGSETRDLQHVAEFGVVMMLFLIVLVIKSFLLVFNYSVILPLIVKILTLGIALVISVTLFDCLPVFPLLSKVTFILASFPDGIGS